MDHFSTSSLTAERLREDHLADYLPRRVLEKSNFVLERSTTHHGEDVVFYRMRR